MFILRALRIIIVLLVFMASPCRADQAVDFAKVGQFIILTGNWYWNNEFRDELKQRYDDGRKTIVAAGGPEKYLQVYDAGVKELLTLPWGKAYSEWNKDQQNKWQAISFPAPDDWIGDSKNPKRYFLILGQEAMRLGYNEPYYINTLGYSLNSELNNINKGLDNTVWLRDSNPDLVKTLLPEIQEAIKSTAAYLKKAHDPLGDGLVIDDFNKIVDNGKIILKAVRNGKLTQ